MNHELVDSVDSFSASSDLNELDNYINFNK